MAEVTYCNSISVAEHVELIFVVCPSLHSYKCVVEGWNITDCVERALRPKARHGHGHRCGGADRACGAEAS